MARSGPAPSPRGPAPSARAEESAERRMPAPRSGRGANGGGEGGEGLCAAGARLAVERLHVERVFSVNPHPRDLHLGLTAFYISVAHIHLKPLLECKNMDSPCL
ncbi:uncharacterized protein ACIGJ3_007056 [Trichechus inunguis]